MNIKNIVFLLIALSLSINTPFLVAAAQPEEVDTQVDTRDPKYVREEKNGITYFKCYEKEVIILKDADGEYYKYTPLTENEIKVKIANLTEQERDEQETQYESLEGQEAFLYQRNFICKKTPAPADFMEFLEKEKKVLEQLPAVVAAAQALEIKKEIQQELTRIEMNLKHLKLEEPLTKFPQVRELCFHQKLDETPGSSEEVQWQKDFEAGSKPHSANDENRLRNMANESKNPKKQRDFEKLQAQQKELQALLKINDPVKLKIAHDGLIMAWKPQEQEAQEAQEFDLADLPKYRFSNVDEAGNYVFATPVHTKNKKQYGYRHITKNAQGEYRLDTWNQTTEEYEDSNSPSLIPNPDFFEFQKQIEDGDRRIEEITTAAQEIQKQQNNLFTPLTRYRENLPQPIIEERKLLELELDFINQHFPQVPLLNETINGENNYVDKVCNKWEEDFKKGKVPHNAETENALRKEANKLNTPKVQVEKLARYNELVKEHNEAMLQAGLADEVLVERTLEPITEPEAEPTPAIDPNTTNNVNGKNPQIDNGNKAQEAKGSWIAQNRKKTLAFFSIPLIAAEATYEYNNYKKALPINKKALPFHAFCFNQLLKKPTKYPLFTITFYATTGINIALAVHDWNNN